MTPANLRSTQGQFDDFVPLLGYGSRGGRAAYANLLGLRSEGLPEGRKGHRGQRLHGSALGCLRPISVSANEARVSLCQLEVDFKAKDITAVAPLCPLKLEGAVVGIDTIGCQQTIARSWNMAGATRFRSKSTSRRCAETARGWWRGRFRLVIPNPMQSWAKTCHSHFEPVGACR